jgi:L-alanine-DL-glutamate epimerase-like enolase superfamily enzyme
LTEPADSLPTFTSVIAPDGLRIDAIETLEVRVPRLSHNRLTTAYATLPDAHHVIVLVHAEGFTGVGEAPPELWWTGEDACSVRNAIDRYLVPALIGKSIGVRDAIDSMDSALAANQYAKAAIEMALFDLLGKALGVPVYALLGGGAPEPLPIKYVIGMMPPEEAGDQATYAKEQGFSYIKIKAGGDLKEDLARVAAVCDVLGPGDRFGVDANAGWRPTTALAALPELCAMGASFLEQPVRDTFRPTLAAITAKSPIPIVAHESIRSLRDGAEALNLQLAHIWALTPSTHGGVTPTQDLLSLARAGGVDCLIGSTLELGVATALLTHLGAAYSDFRTCAVPSDVIGPLYHEHDIVLKQPPIRNGTIQPLDGPGLGVEIDIERLRQGAPD